MSELVKVEKLKPEEADRLERERHERERIENMKLIEKEYKERAERDVKRKLELAMLAKEASENLALRKTKKS